MGYLYLLLTLRSMTGLFLQISDTFIYDPEEASFYSVPSHVGRRMLSGGSMTSPVAATGGAYRAQSPFEFVRSSHNNTSLLCFTTGNT